MQTFLAHLQEHCQEDYSTLWHIWRHCWWLRDQGSSDCKNRIGPLSRLKFGVSFFWASRHLLEGHLDFGPLYSHNLRSILHPLQGRQIGRMRKLEFLWRLGSLVSGQLRRDANCNSHLESVGKLGERTQSLYKCNLRLVGIIIVQNFNRREHRGISSPKKGTKNYSKQASYAYKKGFRSVLRRSFSCLNHLLQTITPHSLSSPLFNPVLSYPILSSLIISSHRLSTLSFHILLSITLVSILSLSYFTSLFAIPSRLLPLAHSPTLLSITFPPHISVTSSPYADSPIPLPSLLHITSLLMLSLHSSASPPLTCFPPHHLLLFPLLPLTSPVRHPLLCFPSTPLLPTTSFSLISHTSLTSPPLLTISSTPHFPSPLLTSQPSFPYFSYII